MASQTRAQDTGTDEPADEDQGSGESNKERIDRELIELLNELRVVLPGIQVLFAFLLTMPFSQRFGQITNTQKTAYFISFMCTAISSVLLIAPSVIHRLRFREHDKEQVLKLSNKLTIFGIIFLSVAISVVVFVITDVLYGAPWSIIIAAFMACLMIAIWYITPLVRRARTGTATSLGEE
jgi:predicted neutral ceramidase superfamily lipid hydrolase